MPEMPQDLIQVRKGTFFGFFIDGRQFRASNPFAPAWFVTVHPDDEFKAPVNDYWIGKDGVFYRGGVSLFHGGGNNQGFNKGKEALDLEPGERKAVLQAVSNWTANPIPFIPASAAGKEKEL